MKDEYVKYSDVRSLLEVMKRKSSYREETATYAMWERRENKLAKELERSAKTISELI